MDSCLINLLCISEMEKTYNKISTKSWMMNDQQYQLVLLIISFNNMMSIYMFSTFIYV